MILYVSTGLIAIIAIAFAYGSISWRIATNRMHASLEKERRPVQPGVYNPEELNGLPVPVQRYFRSVFKNGQPMILAVDLTQSGTFNTGEREEQWKPFTASQHVITDRPGFDWEARIQMAPMVSAKVHDAYIAGEGILHASLFGLVPLARMRGTPEAAQGELMRFLAESAWYPTALMPGYGVQWEAVDDHSARATLEDGKTRVTMLFHFNKDNLIEYVRSEMRPRMVGEKVVPTPWEGRWSNYEMRDGMLIPLEGEVAWILPEGRRPYFRGRIGNIAYEFAQ